MVHNRNLRSNPSLTMHIGDGMTVVIVEGEAHFGPVTRRRRETAAEHNRRYWHYGMKATADQVCR